jgi:hypothetical protein
MKLLVVLLLVICTVFIPATTPTIEFPRSPFHSGRASSVTTGLYWFQVGAWAASDKGYGDEFGQPVTGASVEIRTLEEKSSKIDTDRSYWVGIDLPNDAFIQVGYVSSPQYSSGHPSWFWEYFLPGTADEGTGGFLGGYGPVTGANGTWVKFSLTSSGTVWHAFVNDREAGKVDLNVADSGLAGPYASAEVAQTHWTDIVLGPVEFRNLEYRDKSNEWHKATAAVSLCCYSAGSDAAPDSVTYPYGVSGIPGENNHWLAGTGLTYRIEGRYLWPWYHVDLESQIGAVSGSGWYVKNSQITPEAPEDVSAGDGARFHLNGWTDGRRVASFFTAEQNMTLSAVYVSQYLVTVTSPFGTSSGSGWYDAGSTATIMVSPSSVPAGGLLGQLGVKYALNGWGGDYTGKPGANGFSNLTVRSPMDIHALWSVNPGPILPGILTISVIVAAGIMNASKGTRRRPAKGTVTTLSRVHPNFCRSCGRSMHRPANFCPGCGTRLLHPARETGY